jgi:predicted aminopeptidase
MREFASAELGLPDNGSYRTYADLQRPYVVWNVFATEGLSLQPREWCFPVVGCVSYRGYFREAAALALAKSLRADGYDVYVAGVPAYSTLGWFDDPLLNTFVSWPAGRLAELVFHELAHQRLFVDGDTDFNESFATTVGRMGALRWLESHGTEADREAYVLHGRRREAFLALVGEAKAELEELYASDRSPEFKRRGKQGILNDLRARYRVLKQNRWGGYAGYDRWFDEDINNAKLAALSSYTYYVPAFEGIFHDVGEDFPAFYQAVETLAGLPPLTREARLQQLLDENGRNPSSAQNRTGTLVKEG